MILSQKKPALVRARDIVMVSSRRRAASFDLRHYHRLPYARHHSQVPKPSFGTILRCLSEMNEDYLDDLAREYGINEVDLSFHNDSGLGFVEEDYDSKLDDRPNASYYGGDEINDYGNEFCTETLSVKS